MVLLETYFEDKILLNTYKEDAIIAATKLYYKRWINWNTELLEKVIIQGVKDKEYLVALQSLGKDDE
jgi:hypothetical protein